MDKVLLLPMAISLIYYFICLIYAGPESSFIFMWPLIAAFCLIEFLLLRLVSPERGQIWLLIRDFYTAFFIAGLILTFVFEVVVISGMFKKSNEDVDYCIVLGCAVKGDRPSGSLIKRLDACVEYADEHKDCKIIVTGGKGDGENRAEALVMRDYLIDKGIEQDRIIIEDKACDTYQSFKLIAQMIDKDSKIAILSSNFHISRSIALAKKQGFSSCIGVPAKSDKILIYNYMMREIIGYLKEIACHNI